MAKDIIKEGLTFALGIVKISGEQFGKIVKGLERKNKVSSKEGERMVYSWIANQQKQLERMRKRLKREALKTRIYSSGDLAEMNRVIKKLSGEISSLQKKKKKAEAATRKLKKKALGKRTARKRKRPAKKKRKSKKKKR